jgi:hypothetical protein
MNNIKNWKSFNESFENNLDFIIQILSDNNIDYKIDSDTISYESMDNKVKIQLKEDRFFLYCGMDSYGYPKEKESVIRFIERTLSSKIDVSKNNYKHEPTKQTGRSLINKMNRANILGIDYPFI